MKKISIKLGAISFGLEVPEDAVVRVDTNFEAASAPAVWKYFNVYKDLATGCERPGYGVHDTEDEAEDAADEDSERTERAMHGTSAPVGSVKVWAVGTKRSGRVVIDNGKLRYPISHTIGHLHHALDGTFVYVGQ